MGVHAVANQELWEGWEPATTAPLLIAESVVQLMHARFAMKDSLE